MKLHPRPAPRAWLTAIVLLVGPLPLACTGADNTKGGGQGAAANADASGGTNAPGSGGLNGTGGLSETGAGGQLEATGGVNGELGSGGGSSLDDSADALAALQQWLEGAPTARPALDEQDFASMPLSADDARHATDLLWDDLAEQIRATRQSEQSSQSIEIDGFTLNYETVVLGEEPADGRSLFISMHGGGSAPKETNDQQWQNQILLAESYAPKDALWIAPRAPSDDWNMWFKDHIIPLFDRLITNMIVFEGIHPDKVYLNGYSAGGDGVYQLGPTMADRWAGAAMSAGHPNDMTPANLRNIPFAIHVGGDDMAFDRNLVAASWGQQLDYLQAADPEGYPHQVQVHEGLPHWMNLADQPSVPFIQGFTRNLAPKRVVWRQSTLLQSRFYWLKIAAEHAVKDAEIVATIDGQTIQLESETSADITIRLSDTMLDLDQDVSLFLNGAVVFQGAVSRTILTIFRTLSEREDPAATYSAEISTLAD